MPKGSKKKGRHRAVSWQRASLEDPPAGEPSETLATSESTQTVNEATSEAEQGTEEESVPEASLLNHDAPLEAPPTHSTPLNETQPAPNEEQEWKLQCENAVNEVQTLQGALTEAHSSCNELKAALEVAESENGELRRGLDAERHHTMELNRELSELREIQNQTESGVQGAEQEKEKLRIELRVLEDLYTEAEKRHDKAMREAETERERYQGALGEAHSSCKQLKAALEAAERENEELREACGTEQHHTAKLRLELNALKEIQNQTEAVVQGAEQEKEKLQIELRDLEDLYTEAERRHNKVMLEVETERERYEGALTAAESHCVNFDALKEEFSSLQQLCETLQRQNEEEHRSAGLIMKQHDAMKLQNESLELQIEELQVNSQDELHEITADWEKRALDWQTEKENMTALLKSYEVSESTQLSDSENLKTKLAKAIKKGKRIEEEKEAAEEKCTAAQSTIEALHRELSQLRTEFETLEGAHGELQSNMERLELNYGNVTQLQEDARLALTQAESDVQEVKRQLEKKALELEQMTMMNQEAGEKETTIRQKLQSAIKKGMRIENEKSQVEQQMAEVSTRVVEVMNKVPEMALLKEQVLGLTEELQVTKGQLQSSFQATQASHAELQQLKSEKEGWIEQHSQMEATQKLLTTELEAAEEAKISQTASLEEAARKLRELQEQQHNEGRHVEELKSVVATKEVKLVRAREAIENLRKEKADLLHKHTTLTHEVSTLRSENEILQSQQEDPDQIELQEKLKEIQTLKHSSERKRQEAEMKLEEAEQSFQMRFQEAEDKLETLQNENNSLVQQLKELEELQESYNPPSHAPDPQVVEAVFLAASSVARQLSLPFMESPLSSDQATGQLQAVQIFLEGAEVGIKRTQDQLPMVMSELEASRESMSRLEDEISKLKKEGTTPGSSFSAVEMPTPSAHSYPQGSRVKRRDLQEASDTHVIDFGEASNDDEPETKAGDYTPLISVQAFRSAPPPVLHFMQTVDHQTLVAGRLLGHQPIVRAGVLSYTVLLHILLLFLIV